MFKIAESTHRLETNMWFYVAEQMVALFLTDSFTLTYHTR
jgi:hypothetical protein